jgi:hypothetical protein
VRDRALDSSATGSRLATIARKSSPPMNQPSTLLAASTSPCRRRARSAPSRRARRRRAARRRVASRRPAARSALRPFPCGSGTRRAPAVLAHDLRARHERHLARDRGSAARRPPGRVPGTATPVVMPLSTSGESTRRARRAGQPAG